MDLRMRDFSCNFDLNFLNIILCIDKKKYINRELFRKNWNDPDPGNDNRDKGVQTRRGFLGKKGCDSDGKVNPLEFIHHCACFFSSVLSYFFFPFSFSITPNLISAINHLHPNSIHRIIIFKIVPYLFSKDQLIIHTVGGSNQTQYVKINSTLCLVAWAVRVY